MSLEFLGTALLIISVVTGLLLEGVKKVLDSCNKKYSSNLLAVIISALMTIVSSTIYIAINNIHFSFLIFVKILVLIILSFLVSTLGYDKVMQMINQFTAHKNKDSSDKKDK